MSEGIADMGVSWPRCRPHFSSLTRSGGKKPMSHDIRSRPSTEQSEQHQYPAAETVAHLSEATYQQRVETLAERILPRLADNAGTLQTVNYNAVLGHLKVIERMSFDNPFSVFAHTEYELDAFDWERINSKHPVRGLAEQARRLVAGDVQARLLELAAAAGDERHNRPDRDDTGRGRSRGGV
jgi:hypothetical protein